MATRRNVRGGIAGLNRALRAWPREANDQLRDAAGEVAQDVSSAAASRAAGIGGPAKHIGPTIRPRRDRVPKITMGGARYRLRKGRRQRAGDFVYGAEYGGRRSRRTRQFRPHRGTRGYFLWPTVRDQSERSKERYIEALRGALLRHV